MPNFPRCLVYFPGVFGSGIYFVPSLVASLNSFLSPFHASRSFSLKSERYLVILFVASGLCFRNSMKSVDAWLKYLFKLMSSTPSSIPEATICIFDIALTFANIFAKSEASGGTFLANETKDCLSIPLIAVTSGLFNNAFNSVAPKTFFGFALGTIAITLPFAPAAKLLEIISKAPGLRILFFHSPKRKLFAGVPLSKPVSPKIDIKAFLRDSLRGCFFPPSKSKKSNAGVLSRTLNPFLAFIFLMSSSLWITFPDVSVPIMPL